MPTTNSFQTCQGDINRSQAAYEMAAGKWAGVFNSIGSICTNPKNDKIKQKRFIGLFTLFPVLIGIVGAIGIGSLVTSVVALHNTKSPRDVSREMNTLAIGQISENKIIISETNYEHKMNVR